MWGGGHYLATLQTVDRNGRACLIGDTTDSGRLMESLLGERFGGRLTGTSTPDEALPRPKSG